MVIETTKHSRRIVHDAKVQARMDSDLKQATEAIFAKLGLTATDAIRMFYTQVQLHQGLPFAVRIPNQETLLALRESEKPEELETVGSAEELFSNLGD